MERCQMNGLEKYEKILKQSCLFRQKDCRGAAGTGQASWGKDTGLRKRAAVTA